ALGYSFASVRETLPARFFISAFDSRAAIAHSRDDAPALLLMREAGDFGFLARAIPSKLGRHDSRDSRRRRFRLDRRSPRQGRAPNQKVADRMRHLVGNRVHHLRANRRTAA